MSIYPLTRIPLCSKNKDKKSESNSQHSFKPLQIGICCVRRTKIKNLKAIHNYIYINFAPVDVVFEEQR